MYQGHGLIVVQLNLLINFIKEIFHHIVNRLKLRMEQQQIKEMFHLIEVINMVLPDSTEQPSTPNLSNPNSAKSLTTFQISKIME